MSSCFLTKGLKLSEILLASSNLVRILLLHFENLGVSVLQEDLEILQLVQSNVLIKHSLSNSYDRNYSSFSDLVMFVFVHLVDLLHLVNPLLLLQLVVLTRHERVVVLHHVLLHQRMHF